MGLGSRGTYQYDVGIANGASASDAVNAAVWDTASVQLPSAITNSRMYYKTTNNVDANGDPTGFVAAQGLTGAAVPDVAVAAGETYRVPEEVMAAHYFQFVLGGTAQAAARTLKVTLKG